MIKNLQKKQSKKIQTHLHKAKTGSVLAIYKLFNRYYVKSFFGPFFAFVFPVLIYFILGSLMDYKLMFAGIVGLTTMSALTGMPTAILELKQSVLMKRIGASPVKTSTFTWVIISYYALEILLAILWVMLWSLIIYHDPSVFAFFSDVVGFFSFVYGVFLSIGISITLGFLVASISKSQQQARAISMLIMFVSQFLSGMFITIDVISANELMNWISRFIPHRYSTMYLVSSQIENANPFVFNDILGYTTLKDEWIIFYQNWETIVAYVYPWTIIFICSFVSHKNFSWSAAR